MSFSLARVDRCRRSMLRQATRGCGLKRAGRVHLELQYTPPSPAWVTCKTIVGTWLSLVERTLGVGEVASSNLVVPTIYFQLVTYATRVEWVQAWVRKGPIRLLLPL